MKFFPVLVAFLFCASFAQAEPKNFVLALKERTPIEVLAQSILDPSSPHYQKYYSPEEIRDSVAPDESDYQNLIQALKRHGFMIEMESPTRLMVLVRADSRVFQGLSQTKLLDFVSSLLHPNRIKQPTLPDDLSLIETVVGLEKMKPRRSHAVIGASVSGAATVSQDVIKKTYGFDTLYGAGLSGKGQDIAIATFGAYHESDVKGFFEQSQISPAPAIESITFNGVPALDEDFALETTMDVELAGMIAPGSNIHVFTSAENNEVGEISLFTAVLDDNRSKIVNYSWGNCEASIERTGTQRVMDKVFARAIAQGVNIFVASGDDGAQGCASSGNVKIEGIQSVNWPASEPYAIAVGGTSLDTDPNGNLKENAWSGSGLNGGSGGGVSSFYSRPAFQNQLPAPYDSKRSIPDVSFNANPATGELVWTSCEATREGCVQGKPHWQNMGGTSLASPQWAGFLALVNEARARAQKPTLPFLNPILYSMSSEDRAKTMNDITLGTNGAFWTSEGWDAVTGWGSPRANSLLEYLTNQ